MLQNAISVQRVSCNLTWSVLKPASKSGYLSGFSVAQSELKKNEFARGKRIP